MQPCGSENKADLLLCTVHAWYVINDLIFIFYYFMSFVKKKHHSKLLDMSLNHLSQVSTIHWLHIFGCLPYPLRTNLETVKIHILHYYSCIYFAFFIYIFFLRNMPIIILPHASLKSHLNVADFLLLTRAVNQTSRPWNISIISQSKSSYM